MRPIKWVIFDQAGSIKYWSNNYLYQIPVHVKMADDDKDDIRVSSFYMKKDDVDNYRKRGSLDVNDYIICLKNWGYATLDRL